MRISLMAALVLLAVGCGEALPQGGGDAGGQDQATVAPATGDCESLDESACEAAGAPCEPLVLNLASRTSSDGSRCYEQEGVSGVFGFAVCLDGPAEGRVLTGDVVCAVQPETGEFFHFWSGSLVPDGWQLCRDVAEPCGSGQPPPLECDEGKVEAVVCNECGPTGGCAQQVTACRPMCTNNGECTDVEACVNGMCTSQCR